MIILSDGFGILYDFFMELWMFRHIGNLSCFKMLGFRFRLVQF